MSTILLGRAMSEIAARAQLLRRFNRFYTRTIGALAEDHLESPFSLAEARVLYEMAQLDSTTALFLKEATGLDQGYLSRILARFEKQGLVAKRKAPHDGRARLLQLTAKGRTQFARLNSRAQAQMTGLLESHGEEEQQEIAHHVEALLQLLAPRPGTQPGTEPAANPAFLLRALRPGDLGWVIRAQAILYAREYGWDSSYEILVADILGKYRGGEGESGWIAEVGGRPAGAVFVMRENEEVARLRLLHVEPFARGQGLGRMLVDRAISFARDHGYKTLSLWTNDVLVSARRIYQAAGFRKVREEKHHSFGKDLVGQTWELNLL